MFNFHVRIISSGLGLISTPVQREYLNFTSIFLSNEMGLIPDCSGDAANVV